MKFQPYEPDSLPRACIRLLLQAGNLAATQVCSYTFLTTNTILQVLKRNEQNSSSHLSRPNIKTYSKPDTFTSQKSKNTISYYIKKEANLFIILFWRQCRRKHFGKHCQILKKEGRKEGREGGREGGKKNHKKAKTKFSPLNKAGKK